jgi:hypothetical protein
MPVDGHQFSYAARAYNTSSFVTNRPDWSTAMIKDLIVNLAIGTGLIRPVIMR